MDFETIRPTIRFLSTELISRIVDEARGLLSTTGIENHSQAVGELLTSSGAQWDPGTHRCRIPASLVDLALSTAPHRVCLYDRDGELSADLANDQVHFTPGSAAINILDDETGEIRRPSTHDYVRYARLVDQLEAIDYQSTAFIPADVHEQISDSYRLYLSLIFNATPVVTGAFTIKGFHVIHDLLVAVRGTNQALADKPLAVLSCCPTAPLKWSTVTSQNVVDCARNGIPVEFISMPLTGFVAPGTLVGTLVQHTAETLSGVVISQLAAPGAPAIWGGSPAVFDYRFETTPMGAVETQMIDCATAEIGKWLGLPTQAYISLADAKQVDAQAGLESATGAVLAALAGINSVSGPGMLDFESCQSLTKLVLDNEICASTKRVLRGISVRPADFPSEPHFVELLRDGHSLIADHTQKWFRQDVRFPGPTIDRANRPRFLEDGARSLHQRAREQIATLLQRPPRLLDDDRRADVSQIMQDAAKHVGMDQLPSLDAQ